MTAAERPAPSQHRRRGGRSQSLGVGISVIVVSRNEGANLRRTVDGFSATLPSSGEIIVIDDASTDGSGEFLRRSRPGVKMVRTDGLGVTKARNYGARLARGEVVVFVDAHVDAPPGWTGPLLKALERSSAGAVAPSISVMGKPDIRGFGLRLKGPDLSTEWLRRQGRAPYKVPILPGCFLAMRRDVFERTGGFDAGMNTWGMSDIELSLRFWLQGYELWVVPEIDVPHLFREKHPYEVKWETVLHNTLRTAFLHFGPQRLSRVVAAIRGHKRFPDALAQIAGGDSLHRRHELAARRRHDDDWYFRSFGAAL